MWTSIYARERTSPPPDFTRWNCSAFCTAASPFHEEAGPIERRAELQENSFSRLWNAQTSLCSGPDTGTAPRALPRFGGVVVTLASAAHPCVDVTLFTFDNHAVAGDATAQCVN